MEERIENLEIDVKIIKELLNAITETTAKSEKKIRQTIAENEREIRNTINKNEALCEVSHNGMIRRISELERLVKKEPAQNEVPKTNEEEYDKNWIVHRQIRKAGNEVFIVDWENHQGEWHIENECNQVIHYTDLKNNLLKQKEMQQ